MSLCDYIRNILTPRDRGGFEIPDFLTCRKITKNDAPELQRLFSQNDIELFGDLTVEMIRSFLKYSYSDAIYTVELLGLYGIKFTSEKLQRYSNPPSQDYKLLKFKRDDSEIIINECSQYNYERIKLKRYLYDMKLNTSFLLDGIKLDVLLTRLEISKESLNDLIKPDFYNDSDLKNIYSADETTKQNKTEQFSLDFIDVTTQVNNSENSSNSSDNDEKIKNFSIDTLKLSVRSHNALKNANITTVKDLLDLSVEDLYKISNIGRKSVKELINVQKNYKDFYKIEETADTEAIQKIPSYIADLSLPRPEFSCRLSNFLKDNNIYKIRQLLDFSKEVNLLSCRNFGKRSFDELTEYLKTENVQIDLPYEIVDVDPPKIEMRQKIDDLFNQIHSFEDKFYIDGKKKTVYCGRINIQKKITLQMLADRFLLTRERIRQIEISLLRKLGKIVVQHIQTFNELFEKYGDIIDYESTEELIPLQNYIFVLKNSFNFLDNCPFEIDTNLGLLIKKSIDLDELNIEKRESIYFSAEEITDEIKEKLRTYLNFNEDVEDNFYSILRKIVEYNIENNFVLDESKKQYLLKDFSKENEKLDQLFKELYPEGIHVRQKIEEIYEKMLAHLPTLDCPTPKALEARLTSNSKNLILTNIGFYQHIDTINVDRDVIFFAIEECKKILSYDEHPFLISVVFEKYKEYFVKHGVFSEYLLFSLLKRLDDPSLLFRRLTVYKAQNENFSQLTYFETYFESCKKIIPTQEVENYFYSLGWNDLRLSNYLAKSTNVFKISSGYFHKKNVSCNLDKLNLIIEKTKSKVEECGYVSLDVIKEKNFVDWIEVFEHEDLDGKSMSAIIRAFCPDFPYEVCSNGIISSGEKLKPYDALYQWMNQKCMADDFVTSAQIISFCEDNKFHRYNTKNQIRDKIVEIDEDCWVTYDYLGLNKNSEEQIVENIRCFFKDLIQPYLNISEIISKVNLPSIKNMEWNECLVHSILEKHNDIFKLFYLVIVNPYQTKFLTMDQVVANEIARFTKTWFMDAEKLEKLLRRNKIFRKNETFSHKSIQNMLFYNASCIEFRDQDKYVGIKAEYRELFND